METGTMFLVYENEEGERFFQPWQDVDDVGTLIDPETGDDLSIIGWTTEVPA